MEKLSIQEELKRDILNFIEIVIHHFLYRRNIYPQHVFIQRKIYGLQVFQIKKGVLFDYVHELVENLKNLLNITSTVRINLESDSEIREHLDIDLDKKLNLEKMEFIQPKNERDIIFKKMLFNLDQKIISIVGYDFTQNQHINSFNVQIITDGSQNQNSNAKYAIQENWVLSKIIGEDQDPNNLNINQNQNQEEIRQNPMQEETLEQNQEIKQQKQQIKLIDSSQLSEITFGISHKINE